MEIIAEKNTNIHACMGYQIYHPWKRYRNFDYTFKVPVPEGVLWYNLLTREIIFLGPDEDDERILVKKWFRVPEDVDQRTLVYSFWQGYDNRNPRKGRALSQATIFTTTVCNARCPYCYECGTTKSTMNETVAEQAAEYIIRYSGKKLLLKWFGGEPLLNPKVMDIISKRVRDSGIEYSGHIVTNGYLFDTITDEQLTDMWKVKRVQVTIDGTREIYQRIKGLPDDAFDKLLDSIERLVHLQIKVNIRLHVTPDNRDDLEQLVCTLAERYGGLGEFRAYLRVYAAPLFEGRGSAPEKLTDEQRKRLYDDHIALDKVISSSGFGLRRGIPKIKRAHCMADNGHSIVITPAGSLTPCEHCHDREIIGNVFDGGCIPEKWSERTPEIPECATCFYYPQCVKLKMCEAETPCNEAIRRFQAYRTEQIVLNAYETYKKRRSLNEESDRTGRNGNRL